MGKVLFEISVSLDGFVAGPDPGPEQPLGAGGERLHDWATRLRGWREMHGLEGGEEGPDSEAFRKAWAETGAVVMGRGMFGGGPGPWGDEPWEGWWGDDPPFRVPVFVLTHHPREPLEKGETTFTFVTEGIEAALEAARSAAGERNVAIGGGADVARQGLRAGLVDEMQLHVVPVLLGGGVSLFEGLGGIGLEQVGVAGSPAVAHLRYRVGK